MKDARGFAGMRGTGLGQGPGRQSWANEYSQVGQDLLGEPVAEDARDYRLILGDSGVVVVDEIVSFVLLPEGAGPLRPPDP